MDFIKWLYCSFSFLTTLKSLLLHKNQKWTFLRTCHIKLIADTSVSSAQLVLILSEVSSNWATHHVRIQWRLKQDQGSSWLNKSTTSCHHNRSSWKATSAFQDKKKRKSILSCKKKKRKEKKAQLAAVWRTHRRTSWRSCWPCPPCPPAAPVWGRPGAVPERSGTPRTHGSRWGKGHLWRRSTQRHHFLSPGAKEKPALTTKQQFVACLDPTNPQSIIFS